MDNKYFEKVSNWWSQLHYSSLQKRGLAIIAGLVVLVSALFVMRGSSQEVVSTSPPLQLDTISQSLMVDVAGAVVHPGVYSLPLNSRVVEAIKAAGGLKKGADTSDINQARILKDGEQIYVYPAAAAAFPQSSGTPVRKNGPIMINRATEKDFESLDGIGPVLASRIVTYRKTNGPFSAIEDLLKVPGIGQSKFDQFKNKLRV